MDKKYQNILSELKMINDRLDTVVQNQLDIKRDMRMVFSDITHFENLVLKIVDNNKLINISSEDFHH